MRGDECSSTVVRNANQIVGKTRLTWMFLLSNMLGMSLDIEQAIALLQKLQRGESLPQEFQGRRYVVLHGLDVESMRDPPEDDSFVELAKEWIGTRVAGEANDLGEALRLLWESIELLQKTFSEVYEEPGQPWQQLLAKWLEDGPWGVPADDVSAVMDFGVSAFKEKYPKSRCEFAFYGDAPYEGESGAILELPPKVELKGKDKNLLAACRKNDLARAKELLAKGADARVMDAHADTPLHFAVAHRNRELAEILLEAGADPNAGRTYGHGPVFAKMASRGHTAAKTYEFDDENHFALVCRLLEKGADVKVTTPTGRTLLDVAAHSAPMNEKWVKHFLHLGVGSILLRTSGMDKRPLDHLLNGSLHYYSREEQLRIPNAVRLLGFLGCDPNQTTDTYAKETPVERWLTTGYSAEEVLPEVIVGIAQALVEIGARDEIGLSDSRRPSERAQNWSKHSESMRHYAEAGRILAAGRAG